eukprot:COSAG02_NODE_7953_length_2773_cov_2.439043_2_plen_105_part_00
METEGRVELTDADVCSLQWRKTALVGALTVCVPCGVVVGARGRSFLALGIFGIPLLAFLAPGVAGVFARKEDGFAPVCKAIAVATGKWLVGCLVFLVAFFKVVA